MKRGVPFVVDRLKALVLKVLLEREIVTIRRGCPPCAAKCRQFSPL